MACRWTTKTNALCEFVSIRLVEAPRRSQSRRWYVLRVESCSSTRVEEATTQVDYEFQLSKQPDHPEDHIDRSVANCWVTDGVVAVR